MSLAARYLGALATVPCIACALLLDVDDVAYAPVAESAADAASESAASPCAADTQVDPAHCGQCGHACASGVCTNGVCGAAAVATSQPDPASIAVDGSGIYWANAKTAGEIVTCPLVGCGASPTRLATNQDRPSSLVLTPTHVAWLTGAGVRAVSKDGQGGVIVIRSSTFNSLAAAGSSVYIGARSGFVQRCSISGSCTQTYSGSASVDALHSGRAGLYLLEGHQSIRLCESVSCFASEAITLLAPLDRASLLVIDSSERNALWVEPGSIKTASLVEAMAPDASADAVSTRVVASTPAASAIAVDDTYVYWIDSEGGTVWRQSRAGGTPDLIASGQNRPGGIAVLDGRVFWTSTGDGAVRSWTP